MGEPLGDVQPLGFGARHRVGADALGAGVHRVFRGRHLVEQVEIAGDHVHERGVRGRVEAEVDAAVARGHRATVAVVAGHREILAVRPRREAVGAVADRLARIRVGIVVERVGQRQERDRAEFLGQYRIGRAQMDLEGFVAGDDEPGQLLRAVRGSLQVAVALDVREIAGVDLRVRGIRRVAPRAREGPRRHRRAIGEGPAVAERDREHGGIVVRRDGRGDLVDGLALLVVDDQPGENRGQHAEPAGAAAAGCQRQHHGHRGQHRRYASQSHGVTSFLIPDRGRRLIRARA